MVPVVHGVQPTIPVDSVLLAMVETDVTDVISIQDYRPSQNSYPIRFEIDGTVDASTVPTKRRIYAPPEDIYLCGFFNVFNSANNNSLTVDYDLGITGPNGTLLNQFTGAVVPASGSLQDFRGVKINADIGRFEGSYVEMELTNIAKTAGLGDEEVSTINSKLTEIQDISSSWALKEWIARG